MPREATVLHVDASASDRRAVRDRLEREGLRVRSVGAPAELDAERPAAGADCVVTELDLPGSNGIALLESVRSSSPDTGCVLYTAADGERISAARANGRVLAASVRKDGPDPLDRLARITATTVRERTQTVYPLPSDEDERLDAIDQAVFEDDRLRQTLDRIVDLAAIVLDVPWASVGIVDEHTEQFPACRGLEFDTLQRQETICTYTILDPGVTVVEDITTDPRFADYDSLAATPISFYAGAPIQIGETSPIGTLCVYDDHPRTMSGDDLDTLAGFAAIAGQVIDSRSAALRPPPEVIEP